MNRKVMMAVGLLLAAGGASYGAEKVQASAQDGWTFEITPYAWLAGIDGTIRVRGKEADFSQSFSDLLDKVDAAGSLMAIAENDRCQFFAQGDYFGISEDAKTKGGVPASAESDSVLLTVGAGYTFDGPIEGSTIAVHGGLRYARLDNKVTVGGASASDTRDIYNAVVMLRPSMPITAKLRFNPTLNIGAGDSDLTYELQPELQYNFTDDVAGRFGYRRVYFKEEFSNDSEIDVTFSGFIIGLGLTL